MWRGDRKGQGKFQVETFTSKNRFTLSKPRQSAEHKPDIVNPIRSRTSINDMRIPCFLSVLETSRSKMISDESDSLILHKNRKYR